MDSCHIVVLGVSSLAPLMVVGALLDSARRWLYRAALAKMGRA